MAELPVPAPARRLRDANRSSTFQRVSMWKEGEKEKKGRNIQIEFVLMGVVIWKSYQGQ